VRHGESLPGESNTQQAPTYGFSLRFRLELIVTFRGHLLVYPQAGKAMLVYPRVYGGP